MCIKFAPLWVCRHNPKAKDLGKVPPDLDQTFSAVREAQAALIQTAAKLGVSHSYEQTPKEMVEQFEKLDQGDIDRTLARTDGECAGRQAGAKRKSKPPTEISFRQNSTFVTATLSLRLTAS